MGLMSKIRNFLSSSKNTQTSKPQINEEHEKSRLARKILGLIDNIKRIDCFDSSIWNLSHISNYELMKRSLDELERLHTSLENKLKVLELNKQSQRREQNRESLESSKWTGQKPEYMSELDFDRFQRNDDGR